jgi:hypothetical protein
MGTSPRTIAVAVRVEDRLQPVLQQLRRCRLGHPVDRIRHAEGPDSRPVILRYLHRPHRPGHVAARGHPVPQLVEVALFLARELGDADGVHAGRPSIGPDLLPRLVHEALGDLKRLHLRLRSTRALLPHGVDLWVTVACPAPWLQLHYRAFPATTGRPAPVPRVSTLPLAVSAACGPRFRRPDGADSPRNRPERYRGDRFSCSMPAPATSSRHLYTGHHQGRMQAAPRLRARHPRALSRERETPPVSMPTFTAFGASAVVHTRSSSRRSPDPLVAGLFRIAHDLGS